MTSSLNLALLLAADRAATLRREADDHRRTAGPGRAATADRGSLRQRLAALRTIPGPAPRNAPAADCA